MSESTGGFALSAPDPLATVLAHLSDAKRNGTGYQARCPAHEDKAPSLSISRGDDGRVLLKCFAGCTVEAVVKVWGLTLADLFMPRKIVATRELRYDVRDITGKLVATHIRRDLPDGTKTFAWSTPADSHGLAGRRVDSLPLYRSEKLVLVPSKSTVYVTEGEKAADALGLLGVHSLATVCGAAACPTVAALKPYAGYRLILWPDNDDAGRTHMQRVARAAVEGGAEVAVLSWPEAKDKQDAAEFVDQGGTAESLAKLPVVRFTENDLWRADLADVTASGDGNDKPLSAPEVTVEATGRIIVHWLDQKVRVLLDQLDKRRDGLHCFLSVQRQVGEDWRWLSPRSRQNLYSVSGLEGLQKRLESTWTINWRERLGQVVIAADEMMNRAEPVIILADAPDPGDRVWLLPPLLEVGEITILFADGGIGKSMFSLACAVSVTSGVPVLPGIAPVITCPVLYLDWETNPKEQRRRLGQIAAGMSIHAPGTLFYRRMSGPLSDNIEHLREIVISLKIGLVIADSAGYATDGDINESAVALAFTNAIRALGVTSLIIAHVPREKENRDRPIGSTYFHNAARSPWTLVKEQESGAPSLHLGLVNKKSNNGPLHPTIAFRVDFQADAVRYYRADPQAVAVIAAATNDIDQICSVLRNGVHLTIKGILSELAWTAAKTGTVRTLLNRHRHGSSKSPRWIFRAEGGVDGEREWSLLSDGVTPVTPVVTEGVTGGSGGRRNKPGALSPPGVVTPYPIPDSSLDSTLRKDLVTDGLVTDGKDGPAW